MWHENYPNIDTLSFIGAQSDSSWTVLGVSFHSEELDRGYVPTKIHRLGRRCEPLLPNVSTPVKSGEPRATTTSSHISFFPYFTLPKTRPLLRWLKMHCLSVSHSTLSSSCLIKNELTRIEFLDHVSLGGWKWGGLVEDCLFQPPTTNHHSPLQPYSVQKYLCDVLPTYVQINCLSSSFGSLRVATPFPIFLFCPKPQTSLQPFATILY